MKLLFAWTGITRCAGDCWRELAALPGVSLKVVVDAPRDDALAREVLHGVDFSWAGDETAAVERPDALFVVGWHSPAVRGLVERRDWRGVPKVLCFDMPWRRGLRCFAARFALWRYCRRFRAAYVPGESAARYAKWLGFARVEQGFLSADMRRFADADSAVAEGGRSGFVYVGRRAPEKRIDLIERAYERYRALGGKWNIEYRHDTPYSEMPQAYARAACLVLASESDAWPLVALEAKAAGCDVIMSDRCGNRFDLSARVVPFGDVEALARAMLAAEDGKDMPPVQDLAFWDSREWARRTLALAKELT